MQGLIFGSKDIIIFLKEMMNVERIVLILLVASMLFLSCGCYENDNLNKEKEKTEVTVNMPTDNTVNGYRDKDFEKNTVVPANPVTVISSKDAKYFGNITTKKFHTPDCSVLKNTKSENLYYAIERDEMLSMGYSPCKKCNP